MAGEGLAGMAGGFAPVATGYQPQFRMGFEGAPFLGQHPIVAMMAQPYLAQMMGGQGMVPVGLGHDQNIYDILRHRTFTAMQQQAMAASAAAGDRQNFLRTFRGMAALSGTPYDARMRRHAGVAADVMQQIAPIMAMMAPELLDTFGGHRGSETVMTQQMMLGGRYQLDPASGRLGISGRAMGLQSQRIFQDLYSDHATMAQMHGVTAGQAGSMYNQLVQRGLVSMETGTRQERTERVLADLRSTPEGRAIITRAARDQNVTLPTGPQSPGQRLGTSQSGLGMEDLDRLAAAPAIGDRIRNLETSRITRTLRGYSQAIAAMRDIFGDMGRPNAPMAELMQSLEAMTQGSLAQMTPGRAATIVRATYNLARNTGVSIDSAMMLQQHAAGRAQALGLEPIFATQAVQGGLAFGGAYRGRGLAAHTAWGVFSADQMQQADINLRVGAAASGQANRLGVAMRLSQAAGGFQEGTPAANMISAMRAGFTEFQGTGNRMRSLNMSNRDFYSLLTGARGRGGQALGITENDIREMLSQSFDNREQVDQHDLGNLVRDMQGLQVNAFIGDRVHETLTNRLRGAGVGHADISRSLATATPRIMEQISRISTEDFANAPARTEQMASIFQSALQGTAAGRALARMPTAERESFFRQTASRAYGRVNEAIRGSGFRGAVGWQNSRRLHDPETLREANANRQRAAGEARLQEALTPLGHGSFLRRTMAAIQNATPGSNFAEVVADALGGVRSEDINRQLAPPIHILNAHITAIRALQQQIANMAPGPNRAAAEANLENMLNETRGQSANLARTMRDHGFFGEGSITARSTQEARDAIQAVVGMSQDAAAGTRSYYVGGLELDRARHSYTAGNIAPDEAAAVIIANREQYYTSLNRDNLEVINAARTLQASNPAMSMNDAKDQVITNIRHRQLRPDALTGRRLIDQISDSELRVHMDTGGRDDSIPVGLRVTATGLNNQAATALTRIRRARMPIEPDETQIRAIMGANAGMSVAAARELGRARNRYARAGIHSADITNIMTTRGINENEAIDAAFRDVRAAQYTVGPQALADARVINPTMTDAQLRVWVLAQRRTLRTNTARSFWASDDGARARDFTDTMMAENRNTAELLTRPEAVSRLGTRAIDFHTQLQNTDVRLHELAQHWTGGDIGMLIRSDFTAPDATTGENVRSEVTRLTTASARVQRDLAETFGRDGRQWRMASDAEAVASMRVRGVPGLAGTSGPNTLYGPAVIRGEAERMGNIDEARLLMGLTPERARQLTGTLGIFDGLAHQQRNTLQATANDVRLARGLTSEEEALVRAPANAANVEQLAALGRRKGMTGSDAEIAARMRRINTTVFEPQRRLATTQQQRLAEGGLAIVERLARAFGANFTSTDASAVDMARQFGSSARNRAMGQQLVWSQIQLNEATDLRRAGGNVSGQFGMISQYRAAMALSNPEERAAAIARLQGEIGIDPATPAGSERWSNLTRAFELQQQAGLLSRPDSGRLTMQQLASGVERIRESQRTPVRATAPGGILGGGGGPGSMHITSGRLDLFMNGNNVGTASLDARTGGNIGNNAAPN